MDELERDIAAWRLAWNTRFSNFEHLVAAQATRPPQPGYERTYLYLGNLYAQMGQADEAHQTWLLGLQHHPHDPALKAAAGH